MARQTIEDVPVEASFEMLFNAMLDNAKRILVEEYGRDGLILAVLLSSPEERRRAFESMNERRSVMFGFFYPENGERLPGSPGFDSMEEAVEFWKDKRSTWDEVRPQSPNDLAAFMNPFSGALVVVREVADEAADD